MFLWCVFIDVETVRSRYIIKASKRSMFSGVSHICGVRFVVLYGGTMFSWEGTFIDVYNMSGLD